MIRKWVYVSGEPPLGKMRRFPSRTRQIYDQKLSIRRCICNTGCPSRAWKTNGELIRLNTTRMQPNTSWRHHSADLVSISSKYFFRTCLLMICTAKFPASIIAHPLCIWRFELGGMGSGGLMLRSCQNADQWATKNKTKLKRTVLRTTRTTDSIDPRFSVPSLT